MIWATVKSGEWRGILEERALRRIAGLIRSFQSSYKYLYFMLPDES
jgi:hypothetical protein